MSTEYNQTWCCERIDKHYLRDIRGMIAHNIIEKLMKLTMLLITQKKTSQEHFSSHYNSTIYALNFINLVQMCASKTLKNEFIMMKIDTIFFLNQE